MSVLDPMWIAWQRKIGQRTFDIVIREAGVPNLTSEIEFIPDLGSDKSPLHHLAWSYPSQMKRIWKSWKRRNGKGREAREISRAVQDDAGVQWSEQIRSWVPEGSMVTVYDDMGVWRLMVKFSNGGPVIEGVASDTNASHQEWSAWAVGVPSSLVEAATPGHAVYSALWQWATECPMVRGAWLGSVIAPSGDDFYGQPAVWSYFGTLDEREVS